MRDEQNKHMGWERILKIPMRTELNIRTASNRRRRQCRRRRSITLMIAALIFLVIAGAIVTWGVSRSKDPSAEKNGRPSLQTETLEGIGIESIIQEDRACIAAHYPRTDNEEVNAAVKKYTEDQIAQFFAEQSVAQGEGKKTVKKNATNKDEFYQEFKVYRFSKDVVSFRFSSYASYDGYAHGTEQINTMTWNLKDGSRYALRDVFEKSDYLNSLSGMVYGGLKKNKVYSSEIERMFLKEGVTPSEDNFKNFALDGDRILFFFNRYQIGSKSNHISEFSLGLEDVDHLLKESFRLNQSESPKDAPQKNQGEGPDEGGTDPSASQDPVVSPGALPAGASQEETRSPAAVTTPPAQTPPSVPANAKLVAITFDDGPHKTLTPRLLDVLKKEGTPATFFMLGNRAVYYPEIVKRAAAEGHQVASHTMNHKNLTRLSEGERSMEIGKAAEILRKAMGAKPTAMRPPYGALNDGVKKAAGTPIILWSLDPEDWRYRNADTVYQKVMSKAKDGDIILLHDIHETSVAAAARIIPALKAKGFTLVTVDQLLNARKGKPQAGVTYSDAPPKG